MRFCIYTLSICVWIFSYVSLKKQQKNASKIEIVSQLLSDNFASLLCYHSAIIQSVIVIVKLSVFTFQGQPRRTLPNRSRFEMTKKPQNMFGNLFHMFNAWFVL